MHSYEYASSHQQQFYIGYYDSESNPTVLYELNGYDLLDMPLGYDTLDCFCLGIYGASDVEEYPSFHYAFTPDGRALLDFIFVREDGKTLRIFAAADSCDFMSYEGRIGFEYGSQADLAVIFDEAMKIEINSN